MKILFTDDTNEEESDYVQLSDCYNEIDGRIVTTDITRIEVVTTHSHLLHTPPGTSRSFETSTKNRVNLDRRVKNLHKKSVIEALSRKSLTDRTLNEGLHTWTVWIDKLKNSNQLEVVPFSFDTSEDTNLSQTEISGTLNTSNSKVLKCRNSLMTLMNMLLKNRALNPVEIREELCGHLRATEDMVLERKINELFGWMNGNLFFGLLSDVNVEWSYRLKS